MTRPLYYHQEKAVKKVISGRNVVVSTGTGSGKTESFLIPILTHLISERENGTLDEGVRALLIYPMNALANDQVERLRELLCDYPEITFGSYTGQTLNKYNAALEEYRKLNDNETPKPNELISREQMKATPPHILVTNYAMLEYLMVRPDDSVFFDVDKADKLKFIVLDEAHVYSGTTGIEVSMLLRRLKSTLQNHNINYILTSATLGDEKSNNEVAKFASNLCDSEFKDEDVIRASRIDLPLASTEKELPIDFYRECAEFVKENDCELNKLLAVVRKYDSNIDGDIGFSELIYDTIVDDITFRRVKSFVSSPQRISDISKYMGWTDADTEKFVTVSSAALKNGIRPFDARYHMFLRATESVFITLGPSKKLFFNRSKEYKPDTGLPEIVFEIGTCSFCHSIYLIGKINEKKLIQYSRGTLDGSADAFLLAEDYLDDDEDVMDDGTSDLEAYELCPYCGYIRKAGLKNKVSCEHGNADMIKIWKVNKKDEVKKCPACDTVSSRGIIRMFFTGQEAVTSVIGTALFEELPSYSISIEKSIIDETSGFSFDVSNVKTEKVKEAKQFIAFSDSRQAAAFYASYMGKTYKTILYKRIIVDTIQNSNELDGKPLEFFVDNLISEFEKYEVCDKNVNIKKEAWKAVLEELVDNNGITSLYKMGLFGIDIADSIPIPDNKKWDLSKEEVRMICNEFLLSMMANAAVDTNAVQMTREDREDYTHGGFLSGYTYADANSKKYIRSFIPTKINLSNKRLDYIKKIAVSVGQPDTYENCTKLLEGIWNYIMIKSENNLLQSINGSYHVNADSLSIRKSGYYYCSKCKKITKNNVKNICPTYHCDGRLSPVKISEKLSGNHYYDLYNEMEIRPLRIVEHTAQLSKEKAYEYQKDFKNKKIDILSCSTTFEMGVDVGSLETVFMRNMPPSPSNYAQRAGRAGRSITSAAYALTFCNKSNHDFTFFNDPVKMIKGKILPPSFNINNEKIAIRHVYASAMSFFWKQHPEYFSFARDMMGDGKSDDVVGISEFAAYLLSKPDDLKHFIMDFLPNELVQLFDVTEFGWINTLIGKEAGKEGIFVKALRDYDEEVKTLLNEIERLSNQLKSNGAVIQRLKTFYNEPIIAFLSRKGVFPRYGFPVDTVELNIPATAENNVYGLQLQRDLSMAISEYAPGSEIVANDNLITSRYIKKPAAMLWKMYDYKVCQTCGSLMVKTHVSSSESDDEADWTCEVCDTPMNEAKKTFIIPEFGFTADGNNIKKPGLIKPKRTYNNEISYVGKGKGTFENYEIGATTVEMMLSSDDEMVVINPSNFFVCTTCGYTEVDNNNFKRIMRKEHKYPNGHADCVCRDLRKFSLGYRFNTNVIQIRFKNSLLSADNWDYAYTVLQAILRGFCSYFSIDERDVSGCLHYFTDDITRRGAYGIILYDNTPGGSGYVKMINNSEALKNVLQRAYEIMASCNCGGESGDASCYSCLRNYYNQQHHDEMKRKYFLEFFEDIGIV